MVWPAFSAWASTVSGTVVSGCRRLSFFFFSSRRRHTRYIGDWSSDVCSSDLLRSRLCTQAMLESPEFCRWVGLLSPHELRPDGKPRMHRELWEWAFIAQAVAERGAITPGGAGRSEERRVGKEGGVGGLVEQSE